MMLLMNIKKSEKALTLLNTEQICVVLLAFNNTKMILNNQNINTE